MNSAEYSLDKSYATWDDLLGTTSKNSKKINVYTRADAAGSCRFLASFFWQKAGKPEGYWRFWRPRCKVDAVKRHEWYRIQ